MKFEIKTKDFELSPYTGLNYQSWVEIGEIFLDNIFQHLKSFDDSLVFLRKETEITYPHKNATGERLVIEQKAEKFEGLVRTFFLAAPLIKNNPELKIRNYYVREYYKNQILRSCTKSDENYIGDYDTLQELNNNPPFKTYQQTVETGGLVIGLWVTKAEIWDQYTQKEKDRIASVIYSFAKNTTSGGNWHMFNMLAMGFLHMAGYTIDHEIMLDHAQEILDYYVGDGWYRDGQYFDYYSCWAFNLYAPLWNIWYGYENEPYIAAKFEERSNKLMETYADFFDRDSFTNMWGRSSIYRNASSSAFIGNALLKNHTINGGLARRIVSGSLLQFINREDFLENGIPSLGFYGQFVPLVQNYSCAASPFWFSKVFLCLCLPKEHPFWTEKENNGTWEKMSAGEIKLTTLNGPGLCFSNHQANGETILRTGKFTVQQHRKYYEQPYNKLSYNTKYPWESTVFEQVGKFKNYIVEPQQYVVHTLPTKQAEKANLIAWCGEKEGVLYRKQFYELNLDNRCWTQSINLADFAVPYGILRVDKLKLKFRPAHITLGAYGFPDNGTEIIKKSHGNAKAIILKGHDFTGKEKQLAMTVYDGWDSLDLIHSQGTNPDSENSIVIYASAERYKQYGGNEHYYLVSQVITKESFEDFSDDEIFPISQVRYTDRIKNGAYGPVYIVLKNGIEKKIDFECIEGKLII